MSCQGSPVKLAISGDFAFTASAQVQDLLSRYPADTRAFELDLSGAKALDVSALGMLLRLRAHSLGGDSLTFTGLSDAARKTLTDTPAGTLLGIDTH